jgi:hypothetical protein
VTKDLLFSFSRSAESYPLITRFASAKELRWRRFLIGNQRRGKQGKDVGFDESRKKQEGKSGCVLRSSITLGLDAHLLQANVLSVLCVGRTKHYAWMRFRSLVHRVRVAEHGRKKPRTGKGEKEKEKSHLELDNK